jgi:hypothetical protein
MHALAPRPSCRETRDISVVGLEGVMGILDDLMKNVAGAAAGKAGLGKSLGLEPQHGALADAVMGMLTPHGSVPATRRHNA